MGAALATFHEAQIILYKISYTVPSYRFIYLLVVWLMTLAADLDHTASHNAVISEYELGRM